MDKNMKNMSNQNGPSSTLQKSTAPTIYLEHQKLLRRASWIHVPELRHQFPWQPWQKAFVLGPRQVCLARPCITPHLHVARRRTIFHFVDRMWPQISANTHLRRSTDANMAAFGLHQLVAVHVIQPYGRCEINEHVPIPAEHDRQATVLQPSDPSLL